MYHNFLSGYFGVEGSTDFHVLEAAAPSSGRGGKEEDPSC